MDFTDLAENKLLKLASPPCTRLGSFEKDIDSHSDSSRHQDYFPIQINIWQSYQTST